MHRYKYLIIGGGMAADSALKGIRMSDPSATVGLVSDEMDKPYNRPPLSKTLWDGLPLEEIWRPNRGAQVTLHLGRRIVALDPARKQARDQSGEIYVFEQALLAVGGSPRRIPGEDDAVIYFRTLADYRRLRALAQAEPITIVGAGLIGTELAACLRKAGFPVELYCGSRGLVRSVLPQVLSNELARSLEGRGVRLHRLSITRIQKTAGGQQLTLNDGRNVPARRVLAGLGLIANTQLATDAGIVCAQDIANNQGVANNQGINVDASLKTSSPGIFAAGDCVNYWCSALSRRVNSQHEEHANFSGIAAGRAMAGKAVNYASLPYFYSRVFDHAYEGIGITDTALEHHVVAPRGPMEATVYYLESQRVVGVLFWNVRADLERATELIEAKRVCTAGELVGRL